MISTSRTSDFQISGSAISSHKNIHVEIAKARIAHRVEHGGHGIPDADVERRYFESFEHLNKVLCECNIAVLYDNTDAFKRFAIYKNGVLLSRTDEVPEWYKKYIRQDDMV